MFRIIIFSTIMLSSSLVLSQNYNPLIKGEIRVYQMNNSDYIKETLNQEVEINGKLYTQIKTNYSWGVEKISNIRIDEKGNRIYLNSKTNLETIEFPHSPEKGQKWESTDKAWTYEIHDLNATFHKGKIKYENCLVIKASQIANRDKDKHKIYYNYYSNTVGYVGSKASGEYVSWFVQLRQK